MGARCVASPKGSQLTGQDDAFGLIKDLRGLLPSGGAPISLSQSGATMVVALFAIGGCRNPPASYAGADSMRVSEHPVMVAVDSTDVIFPWLAIDAGGDATVWLNDRVTGLPLLIGRDGRSIGTVGQIGDGPGEMRAPRAVVRKGDSLAFSRSGQPNLDLFDPELRFVRTIRVPILGLSQALFFRGDTMMGVGSVRSEASFGLPFHIYDSDGTWVRSFGDRNRSMRHDFTVRNRRVVAGSTDSTFWSVRYDSLMFEEWHIDGSLVRRFQPNLTWVQPLDRDFAGLGAEPVPAQILSMRVSTPNLILSLFTRPRHPDAGPARDQNRFAAGKESTEPAFKSIGDWLAAFNKEVEQVLVSIDPNTGTVIREIPVLGMMGIGFLSDFLIFGVRFNEDGAAIPIIDRIPLTSGIPREN